MTDFPFDIVGFDLDGTLLDTSFELGASLNHALESDGRTPVQHSGVRSLMGRGIRQMLANALLQTGSTDEDTIDRLFPLLLNHYRANLGNNSPPFPGLLDMLGQLRASGAILAVVTNKLENIAVELLERTGFAAHFVTIIGGDTMGEGNAKPKPDPILEMIRRGGGRAAFVGDSIHDVQSAHAAGIPCVAVSFGYRDRPVEELGADAVIDHYDALIPALRLLA